MKQYLTIQTENLLSYIFQFKCCVLYSTTSGFSQKCHFVLNSGGEIRDEIRKKNTKWSSTYSMWYLGDVMRGSLVRVDDYDRKKM